MNSNYAGFMLVDVEAYPSKKGSGNSEIVDFSWVVYDAEDCTVTQEASYPIRQESTVACDGTMQEKFDNGYTLGDAVQQFDSQMFEKCQISRKPITIVTFGKGPLGETFRAEAKQKGITLYTHYSHFIDISDVLRENYSHLVEEDMRCLSSVAQKLGVDVVGSCSCGLERCHTMAGLVNRLMKDGVKLGKEHAVVVPDEYESVAGRPKSCVSISTTPKVRPVVRLSGLPWDVNPQDIIEFFKPICRVALADVHVVTGFGSRTNGEAYVTLGNIEYRDAAIQQLHGKCVGLRWVDVFKSSPEELNRYLSDKRVATEGPCPGSEAVVRLRGLPWSCNEYEVVKFFQEGGFQTTVDQVVMGYSSGNRLSGGAWVAFEAPEVAEMARKQMHKAKMGTRYIETFPSTQYEMDNAKEYRIGQSSSHVFRQGIRAAGGECTESAQLKGACAPFGFTTIRLRGLPFKSNDQNILGFFNGFQMAAILPATACQNGKPSGEAYVQFANAHEAWHAFHAKNRCCMERRYIELFASSKHEMDMAAQGFDPKTIRKNVLAYRPY